MFHFYLSFRQPCLVSHQLRPSTFLLHETQLYFLFTLSPLLFVPHNTLCHYFFRFPLDSHHIQRKINLELSPDKARAFIIHIFTIITDYKQKRIIKSKTSLSVPSLLFPFCGNLGLQNIRITFLQIPISRVLEFNSTCR